MDLSLHPAAAQAINAKGNALLPKIVRLELRAQPSGQAFQTDRILAGAINDKNIIGDMSAWLTDAMGKRCFVFVNHHGKPYGFSGESYLLVDELIDEILKIRWVQSFLSKSFVEDTIINWCRESVHHPVSSDLSAFLTNASKGAIKKFTMWAPIERLDVEAPFTFGSVKIAPMTQEFFDELEASCINTTPAHTDDIQALFGKMRKDMQGGAAVVLEIEAERGYVVQKGLARARDAVGLIRFISVASNCFSVVCPISLLGAQSLPIYNVITIPESGGFSASSGRIPKRVAFGQISKNDVFNANNHELAALGRLTSEDGLSEFQRKLRSCVLAYTKGTTFSDSADRLVYTCSALEGLLLKDTSEAIQQNLGERVAFLISKGATERISIVRTVRDAYALRSRYIHHRNLPTEEETLDLFTRYARAALLTALLNMDSVATAKEFIDAIDAIKFGG